MNPVKLFSGEFYAVSDLAIESDINEMLNNPK